MTEFHHHAAILVKHQKPVLHRSRLFFLKAAIDVKALSDWHNSIADEILVNVSSETQRRLLLDSLMRVMSYLSQVSYEESGLLLSSFRAKHPTNTWGIPKFEKPSVFWTNLTNFNPTVGKVKISLEKDTYYV